MKSGHTWNHAHADAASFLLWHDGEPVIIDSGSCAYSSPEYRKYFLRSQAHNVVLLDGKGQAWGDNARSTKFPGSIPILLDDGDTRAVVADATGPTANLFTRNYRSMLWIGDVLIVLDELRSHQEGHFEWLLHYAGDATYDADHRRITIKTAHTGAVVQSIWPETVTHEVRNGFIRNYESEERSLDMVDYLAVIDPDVSREGKFITAIVPGLTETPKDFEQLGGEHYIGTAWQTGDVRTEVYLNLRADGRRMHRNANSEIGPWRTDAYVLVLQRPRDTDDANDISRILMLGGSYLRTGDTIVLNSLAQVNAVWEPASAALTIDGANAHRIRLRMAGRPATVKVNGRPVSPTHYDDRLRLVDVRLPER